MSYSIQWDNADQTVVFQQYTDTAVKEDLYSLSKKSAEMLRSVAHTVHLIIDERPVKVTLNYTDIKFLESNVPDNQGAVVMIVNKSGLAYKKMIQDLGRTLAPKAFDQPYFAETLEEARQLLQEQFEVHYP
ncbi:MAG: hypothetical protein H0X30_32595 [Anaerolineae bacterium]|nr:hypothetical protein [Anaerolineae bacterium]